MKALLVNPHPYYASGINEAALYPPIGLAYIAGVLEQNGFESKIIDANALKIPNERILDIISSEQPEIVGISANILTSKAAIELAQDVKNEFKDVLVVCGGPMPTALPERFLSFYDVVVRGEGEKTFLEIVKGEKIRKIKGISFKRNGKVIHTPPRGLIKNIDELPFPAWHLLIPKLIKYKGQIRRKPMAPIITSRGCPYPCIYCNKNIFGYLFRARSVENVSKEIDWLVGYHGVKEIHIMDDNFTFDIKRAEKIFDMIANKKYGLIISCQVGVRADKLTPTLVRKMKLAGCYRVGIGIESGDEKILKKIKKKLSLNDIKKACLILKRVNIKIRGFFMLGIPGDTPKTMWKTIKFAKEIDPYMAAFAITIPFPDTPLYSYIQKNGRFIEDVETGVSFGFFGKKVFFETEETKEEDVLKYQKFAYRKFYLRFKKILEILTEVRSREELKWLLKAVTYTPFY